MKYFNLLILFMITLKCRAAEESTTIKYSTVEEYSNTEALSASTTEGKLENIKTSSEHNQSENTPINDSDDDAVDVKEIEDGLSLSRRLVQQGTRMVKDIASFIKGIAQLKETNSKDDEGADDASQTTVINTTSNATDDNEEKKEDEKSTTVNCSTDENITKREVSNASTTEESENALNESTQLPNINSSSEGTVAVYTTDANTVSLLTIKEFSKLPILKKLRQRPRKVVKIIGSLMEGLARLNDPDSEEDEGFDNEVVMNLTNSEVFNAVTTKAPENMINKWTQLPNINSPSETPVIGITLIKATVVNNISPFTNKEFGKLLIPTKSWQRTRTVTNIIGSLVVGLTRLNEPDSEEDEGANDKEQGTLKNFTVTNVTNGEVFNVITTEAPENIVDKWTHLPNIISSSETPIIENTLIKTTFFNGISLFKNKDFGKLPIPKTPLQRTRKVVKIVGSLMKGFARLNEPYSEEETVEDDEETPTLNFTSVDNVTSEVFKENTTEAPKNLVVKWTPLANINSLGDPIVSPENTLIHATHAKGRNPFKKEIEKLPIPIRLPQHGSQLMGNIVGSFVKVLVQGTDANDED